jgi:hypothetical protein
MSREDIERAQRTDRRAVVNAARQLLDELNARLQRRDRPEIIYKIREDALISRPRLRYRVTDNARYR